MVHFRGHLAWTLHKLKVLGLHDDQLTTAAEHDAEPHHPGDWGFIVVIPNFFVSGLPVYQCIIQANLDVLDFLTWWGPFFQFFKKICSSLPYLSWCEVYQIIIEYQRANIVFLFFSIRWFWTKASKEAWRPAVRRHQPQWKMCSNCVYLHWHVVRQVTVEMDPV